MSIAFVQRVKLLQIQIFSQPGCAENQTRRTDQINDAAADALMRQHDIARLVRAGTEEQLEAGERAALIRFPSQRLKIIRQMLALDRMPLSSCQNVRSGS